MAVELKEMKIMVPKEASEALEPIIDFIKGIRKKEPIAVIIGQLLPKMMEGIEGADKIPQEVRDNRKELMQLAAVEAARLIDALIGESSQS